MCARSGSSSGGLRVRVPDLFCESPIIAVATVAASVLSLGFVSTILDRCLTVKDFNTGSGDLLNLVSKLKFHNDILRIAMKTTIPLAWA